MAKINTEAIENYANMTAEEKLAALEAYEYDDAPAEPSNESAELTRLKQQLSKANGEAAEYKKKLRLKQTDEEAKAAQEAAEREALAAELETLRKEKTVAKYKAEYLGLGYDEKLASDTAAAMADGEHEIVFANQRKFLDAQKKNIMAEALNKQPELSVGNPPTSKDAEAAEMARMRESLGLPV